MAQVWQNFVFTRMTYDVIDGEGLQALVESMTNNFHVLGTVNLSGSRSITSPGLRSIALLCFTQIKMLTDSSKTVKDCVFDRDTHAHEHCLPKSCDGGVVANQSSQGIDVCSN